MTPFAGHREIPTLTTASQYAGEPAIRVWATQLPLKYTRTDATRIVSEWCQFFIEPKPILELVFVSRTPKRLFAALAGQTQLRLLGIKWGDYEDPKPLTGMTWLVDLWLGGATNLQTVSPLAELREVERLAITSIRDVRDLSPIASMESVTSLQIGGSHHIAHIGSIEFLAAMPQLTELSIHSLIVDSLDYSPLLRLPNLTSLRVMEARGMRPSGAELAAAIPALRRQAIPR